MEARLKFQKDVVESFLLKKRWYKRSFVSSCDLNASQYGEECAVVDFKRKITWTILKRETDRIAIHLKRLGVKKGDVFLVILPNTIENFAVRIAFYKAGVLGAFPPMTFREAELVAGLDHLMPKGVIFPYSYEKFDYYRFFMDIKKNIAGLKWLLAVGSVSLPEIDSIDEIVNNVAYDMDISILSEKSEFDLVETSNIFTSSGSTGYPKLVRQNIASHLVMSNNLIERLKLKRDDVIGIFIPLSAGPGSMFFFCGINLGAKIVLLNDYRAEEAFRVIEEERITCISTTAAIVMRMIESNTFNKYDITSLRVIRCGAAPISSSDIKQAEKKLKCPIVTAAGSGEAYFTQASLNDRPNVRQNTVGKVINGNETKIVDEKGEEVGNGDIGELWIRGAGCNLGYYNNEKATKLSWTEDYWYKSGDLVKVDSEGNFIFVGRKSDMIIRGGQNIYPIEIEDILSKHPKISSVAVIGISDKIMGEKSCACIVKKRGESLDPDEVIKFLDEHGLAQFKYPEAIEFFNELPLLVSLKVDKKALKSMVEGVKR